MRKSLQVSAVCFVFAGITAGARAQDVIEEFNYEIQISGWEKQSGEVVTPSARKAALKAIATDFTSTATYAGINPTDASKVAMAIRDAGYVSTKSQGVIAKWSTGEVHFGWEDADQYATVSKTLKPELISLHLDRLPRITVVVDPVPPVDYLVEINGERVRTTDKGQYRVDIGDVVVRVTRASRQDCLWKGNLQAGAEQQVACKL